MTVIEDHPDRLAQAQALAASDPVGALEILEHHGDSGDLDSHDRADLAYARARIHMIAGDPQAALDEIDEARELYTESGDDLAALRTGLGRINILDDLGRHDESLATGDAMLRQLGAVEADPETITWMRGAVSENLGATLGWIGRHEQAVAMLESAGLAYERVGSAFDRARISVGIGIEAFELGDTTTAIDRISVAVDDIEDEVLEARCLTYLARARGRMGEYASAGAILDEQMTAPALATVDELEAMVGRAELLADLNLWPEVTDLIAELQEPLCRNGRRRDLAQLALVAARADAARGRPADAAESAAGAVVEFDAIGHVGRAAAARVVLAGVVDRPERARELLSEAFGTLERLDERSLAADAALALAHLIEDCEERQSWLDRAEELGAGESRPLMWRLKYERGRIAGHLGSDDAVGYFSDSLSTLRSLRSGMPDDAMRATYMVGRRQPVESLVSELLDRDRVDDALEVSLAERAWSLSGYRHRAAPGAGSTKVVYQAIGDDLFAFIDTAAGVQVVELDAGLGDVVDQRRRLDAQWRRLADRRMRTHLTTLRAATDQILADMYAKLLAPVEEVAGSGDLVVVPVGALAGLPWNAFHDGLGYVIERRNIMLSPTGASGPPVAGGRTLVVAYADSKAPAIDREAAMVTEVSQGTLLQGAAATVDSVREAAGDHDVIHFACHGEFRSDNPQMSGLRLADRLLNASELATWDLSDRWMVLAACSSGRQRDAAADELLGLPRGFLLGGSSGLVMNLWPVDDVASVGLMAHFHLEVGRIGPAEAVRSAQLAALDTHPHPYLWAPAIVYAGSAFSKASTP